MVFPAGGNLEINTVTTFFEFGITTNLGLLYTVDFGQMMYRVNGKNYVVRASCPRKCTS